MKNTALNIQKTFGELGSFWHKILQGKARDHAKTLCGAALHTSLVSQMSNTVANFLNDADNLYATNYGFHFEEAYQALSTSLVEDGLVLDKPVCLNPLSTENTWYVVPFSLNLELYTITGWNNKKLINGIDFRQTANYLWFSERPYNPNNLYNDNPDQLKQAALDQVKYISDSSKKTELINQINNTDYSYSLFPNKFLNLNGKWKRGSFPAMSNYSVLANTSNMPVGINAQYVANYQNGANQSLRDFQRFLNATANAIFVPVDSIYLYNVKIGESLYAYVFKDIGTSEVYILHVNTYHGVPDLTANSAIYAGTAILPPVQVLPVKSQWVIDGKVTSSMVTSFLNFMGYNSTNTPLLSTIDPNINNAHSTDTLPSADLTDLFTNKLSTALGIVIDTDNLRFYALGDESDIDWHQDIGTKVKYMFNIIMQSLPMGFFPIVRVRYTDASGVKRIVDYNQYVTP